MALILVPIFDFNFDFRQLFELFRVFYLAYVGCIHSYPHAHAYHTLVLFDSAVLCYAMLCARAKFGQLLIRARDITVGLGRYLLCYVTAVVN